MHPTQPLKFSQRHQAKGLRGTINRILDDVAPKVEDRQLLVKMGCGRPSLMGDHTRNNHVTRAFHI